MWQDQTTQCSCLNGEVNCGNWLIDDHLYSAILRSLEQTHCARLWLDMSDKLFIARFLNIHRSGVLTALAWLVPHETAAISAQVLCTPYNHAPCHFMQSHIRKVYVSLAVTCHLLAEWPGSFTCYCGNAGVERIPKLESAQKVDPGEEILQLLLQGFEPGTFQSRVRHSNLWTIPVQRSNHWAIPIICVMWQDQTTQCNCLNGEVNCGNLCDVAGSNHSVQLPEWWGELW